MMWDDYVDEYRDQDNTDDEQQRESPFNFDLLSLLSKPKDYYKILEVDFDATEEEIRSNYIRLALSSVLMGLVGFVLQKWHPDKHKEEDGATSKFQEINEAYQVLSDPVKRQEYDKKGVACVYDCNIMEYLNHYKGLILTCNGLGMKHSIWWIGAEDSLKIAHSIIAMT
ncbi:hypothetical protein Cgig2_029840 [Carnegiea gigantea]|uniref:J domain-containing protein n=1 Tax=Carnegiea gigantea TaxID=171969 RepID=A0A9Q1GTI6_9CARY|nr:hypothetical protein Cgig2_029840 [Carnegiea gigantea]